MATHFKASLEEKDRRRKKRRIVPPKPPTLPQAGLNLEVCLLLAATVKSPSDKLIILPTTTKTRQRQDDTDLLFGSDKYSIHPK